MKANETIQLGPITLRPFKHNATREVSKLIYMCNATFALSKDGKTIYTDYRRGRYIHGNHLSFLYGVAYRLSGDAQFAALAKDSRATEYDDRFDSILEDLRYYNEELDNAVIPEVLQKMASDKADDYMVKKYGENWAG